MHSEGVSSEEDKTQNRTGKIYTCGNQHKIDMWQKMHVGKTVNLDRTHCD